MKFVVLFASLALALMPASASVFLPHDMATNHGRNDISRVGRAYNFGSRFPRKNLQSSSIAMAIPGYGVTEQIFVGGKDKTQVIVANGWSIVGTLAKRTTMTTDEQRLSHSHSTVGSLLKGAVVGKHTLQGSCLCGKNGSMFRAWLKKFHHSRSGPICVFRWQQSTSVTDMSPHSNVFDDESGKVSPICMAKQCQSQELSRKRGWKCSAEAGPSNAFSQILTEFLSMSACCVCATWLSHCPSKLHDWANVGCHNCSSSIDFVQTLMGHLVSQFLCLNVFVSLSCARKSGPLIPAMPKPNSSGWKNC